MSKRTPAERKAAQKIRSAKWYKKNKALSKAQGAQWRQANPEKLQAIRNRWAEKERTLHRDRKNARAKRWREANRLHASEIKSRSRQRHACKHAAGEARRNAAKLRATPAWGNTFFISEAYDLAQRRTKATGVSWHVDHIVPLRSQRVCGLHVENNLRVIPATHNTSKGNRHWPGMPEQRIGA
jgi:hypothetical protein